MPKTQCYYEILGIDQSASSDDVKKAYRNLALVWHPDKNQTNPEEAHAKFQVILKAYETLSDSRERDWYDRHKNQILSEDTEGDGEIYLNLFPYFSSSCYANFDDSEDGFYTVYREVFSNISKEEEQGIQQTAKFSNTKNKHHQKDLTSYPTFGDSNSSYDEVVRPFYSYWSGFCTGLTFDHLDKYNTTEAENRRILRAMEKENKKVKDAARKERNSNVRKLVEFIKKRDKRLKAHKLLIDKQNQLNREKTAEKQRLQREKGLKESTSYKPTVWEDMNDIEEQLKQLESHYDNFDPKDKFRNARVKDTNVSEEVDDEEVTEEVDFFCPACNKDFRSMKAFENHEASKKHKQNVTKLTKLLNEEEKMLNK